MACTRINPDGTHVECECLTFDDYVENHNTYKMWGDRLNWIDAKEDKRAEIEAMLEQKNSKQVSDFLLDEKNSRDIKNTIAAIAAIGIGSKSKKTKFVPFNDIKIVISDREASPIVEEPKRKSRAHKPICMSHINNKNNKSGFCENRKCTFRHRSCDPKSRFE
jgi:hypothetical protein